jgi:Tfp pilus assembly protein PilV
MGGGDHLAGRPDSRLAMGRHVVAVKWNGMKRHRDEGFTLIETMVAVTVLVVGILGLGALVVSAVSANNRNKLDTGAITVAQQVLEVLAAQPADTSPVLSMKDCNPAGETTWSLATAASASPGSGAGTNSVGAIDFTQAYSAVPANYKMLFVTCGANGVQTTYDIRWNVQTVANLPNTKLFIVGVRPLGAVVGGQFQSRFFAPPASLRTIAGK